MKNLKQKAKEIFGLNKDPEITELDINRDNAFTRYVKSNFLNALQPSGHKIDSLFKLKKEKEGYLFEGVIVYHNQKNKILYFDQHLSDSHASKFSQMNFGEETDWKIPVDNYKELASHAENYFLSVNPEKSTNHFEKTSVEIVNKLGLHARPAASFAQIANNYESEIYVRNGEDKGYGNIEIGGKKYVDGKSIMALMTLGAPTGSSLEILAKGEDSQEAIKSLAELVRAKFGENQYL